MRGALHFSFLGGIILCMIVVLVGSLLIGQVSGFDVKKYFGLQPLLGEPSEIGAGNILYSGLGELETRCGIFAQWIHPQTNTADSCNDVGSGKTTVCTFKSEACPAGTYAVSCATRTDVGALDEETGKKYGDDVILSLYIDEATNQCVVESVSIASSEQARYVDVLCTSDLSSGVEYIWSTVKSGTLPSNGVTIGSGVQCSSGFTPVFGMVKVNDPLDETTYIFSRLLKIGRSDALIYPGTSSSVQYNNIYGKVCIADSLISDCNIKQYDSVISDSGADDKIVRQWYFITLSDNMKGKFVQGSCPGDAQLVYCGGGYTPHSETDYPGLVSLFANNLVDVSTNPENKISIQTCNILYTSERYENIDMTTLCAENIWHWSDWITSTDPYPSFSINCPSGYKAIACASDTASLESGYGDIGGIGNPGGGKYGEDAIGSIYFNGDSGCIVRAKDKNTDNEHKRRVGVLCIEDDIYSTDFQLAPDKAFDQASGDDYKTFTSNPCPSADYLPIFCTVKMNVVSDYEEDQITGIDIDQSSRTCKVTLADQSGTNEFKGIIGALCAKSENVIIETAKGATLSQRLEFENPFFMSDPCPAGAPTTALTVTSLEDDAYKEDFIMSMVPYSDSEKGRGFVVQAEDTIDAWNPFDADNEHRRRMGVVCLDYEDEKFVAPPPVIWSLGVHGTSTQASAPGRVCIYTPSLGTERCTPISASSSPLLTVTLVKGEDVTLRAIPQVLSKHACLLNSIDMTIGYCKKLTGTLTLTPTSTPPLTVDASGAIYAYFY